MQFGIGNVGSRPAYPEAKTRCVKGLSYDVFGLDAAVFPAPTYVFYGVVYNEIFKKER